MMIGSLSWFVDLGIRVGTPDGQELAGRADTYVYIPVSVLAALALTRLVNSGPVRRWGASVTATVVAAIVALQVNGLANGWPPYWERLPGPHLVSSFESSVDPQEIAISYWSLAELGPDQRIAADAGIYPVLIGYGDQNPQQIILYLYTPAKWSLQLADEVAAQGLQYVETDTRLTKSLPAGGGTYFPGDTQPPTKPLALSGLTKFNHVQGIARVYDDGTINFYDLVVAGYVPTKP
jgi:hypothetical protein